MKTSLQPKYAHNFFYTIFFLKFSASFLSIHLFKTTFSYIKPIIFPFKLLFLLYTSFTFLNVSFFKYFFTFYHLSLFTITYKISSNYRLFEGRHFVLFTFEFSTAPTLLPCTVIYYFIYNEHQFNEDFI